MILTILVAGMMAIGALLNAGRNFLAQAMINDTPTFFTNANARLCVGDSTAVYGATQTDLQAATNKLRKAMDSTYPQRSDNVLTFKSTFGTSDANFAWEEWGVANDASAGVLFNRKVESLGTKTSAQSWVFTATLTFGVGS
jgi:hypothetical protein